MYQSTTAAVEIPVVPMRRAIPMKRGKIASEQSGRNRQESFDEIQKNCEYEKRLPR